MSHVTHITVAQAADRLCKPDGPPWAHEFTRDEVLDALRAARSTLRLNSYVQIPPTQLAEIVSTATVHLNRLDPERMARAINAMKQDA